MSNSREKLQPSNDHNTHKHPPNNQTKKSGTQERPLKGTCEVQLVSATLLNAGKC